MTLYVDSSALIKHYVEEHDADIVTELLDRDPVRATCRITEIEVRRNLQRLLTGDALLDAKERFLIDLDAFALLSIDALTCNEASAVAEQTLCKSLDALHIASALRAGEGTTFLTFDHKQAAAARELGLHVVGV